MNWGIAVAAAAFGYLCGSVSFARIVYARQRPGEAPPVFRIPTTDGEAELVTHAIGGANVMVGLGPRWGMFVSALDMAKAFVPTLALRLLVPGPYYLIVPVAVLIGHLWPVWYRFSGGGGNSVVIGGMLAVSPLGLIVTQALGGLAGMFFPAVAFLLGNLLMVPWFWWRAGPTSPEMAYAVATNVLYVAGQVPELIAFFRLKRAGHSVDTALVIRTMKGSLRRDRPGGTAE